MYSLKFIRALASLAQLTICILIFSVSSYAQPSNDIYRLIKETEKGFPIPVPSATVRVGVFDAATEGFIYSDQMRATIRPVGGYRPRAGEAPNTTRLRFVNVNAVKVILVFEAKNSQGGFQATVNNVTVSAPAGSSSVIVDARRSTKVNFTLRSGIKSYSDNFEIVRPPIIGAGAFTIPALPIAIVYEPPQDSQNKNRAIYSTTHIMGTTIGVSFSEEDSTQRPASSKFDSVINIKTSMELLGSGLENSDDPTAKGVGKALKVIAQGLGSVNASEQKARKVTQDHKLEFIKTQKDTYPTGLHKGPGIGDRVIYVKDVKLVWLAEGGNLRLGYLGDEGIFPITVERLKTNQATGIDGLSPKTIQALLRIDPFAIDGPMASLPSSRFAYIETYGANASPPDIHTVEYATNQSDLNTTISYTSRIENYRKGWLSFIGVGITDNKEVTFTTTHSTSRGLNVGHIVQTDLELYAQPNEFYAVESYYDRIFNTFAFTKEAATVELLSGVLKDVSGRVQPRKLITLEIGDKKYITRTDAQGNYVFRASTRKSGRGMLMFGSLRRDVQLSNTPLRGIELRH